jgi:hypothetical protein
MTWTNMSMHAIMFPRYLALDCHVSGGQAQNHHHEPKKETNPTRPKQNTPKKPTPLAESRQQPNGAVETHWEDAAK